MRNAHGTPLQIVSEWQPLLDAARLTTLDAIFALPNDASLSKPGLPRWRERLHRTLRDNARSETEVFIKRFESVPLRQQLRRWLTDPNHGTAWTEWTWLNRMAQAGIAAPAPIAYGEEMVGAWERRSAVLMGSVSGTSLEQWCRRHPRRLASAAQCAVADVVARFHALGIVHRDLYLAHLFCDDPDAPAPRVSMIDLQRVRRLGWRQRRWLVKDLASLNYSTPDWAATPRDRMRWLKRYLAVRTLDRAQRILARLILAKTERIRQHDERRQASLKQDP